MSLLIWRQSYRYSYQWQKNKGDPTDSAEISTLLLSGVSTSLGGLSVAYVDEVVHLLKASRMAFSR